MSTVNVRNVIIGEGIPKVYMPIVGKTKEELLSEIGVLKSVLVDVVEQRMDWFEEVECCEKTVAILQVSREAMPEMPILATFRSKREGGELRISTTTYAKLNKAAIGSGDADLIDVELLTGEAQVKELTAHAYDKSARAIMSSHDFDKTPSHNEVPARLKAVQILGADIPKIAVTSTCKADVITLLQVTSGMHENFVDRPVITMLMADTGVLSRLCGGVFGSALTFGTAKKASAPGQIGIEGLRAVLSLLHKSL